MLTTIQEQRVDQMTSRGFRLYDVFSSSVLLSRRDRDEHGREVVTKVQVKSDGEVLPAPF